MPNATDVTDLGLPEGLCESHAIHISSLLRILMFSICEFKLVVFALALSISLNYLSLCSLSVLRFLYTDINVSLSLSLSHSFYLPPLLLASFLSTAISRYLVHSLCLPTVLHRIQKQEFKSIYLYL